VGKKKKKNRGKSGDQYAYTPVLLHKKVRISPEWKRKGKHREKTIRGQFPSRESGGGGERRKKREKKKH